MSTGQTTDSTHVDPVVKIVQPDLRSIDSIDRTTESLEKMMHAAEQAPASSPASDTNAASQQSDGVDPNLVRQTRIQIRTIVNEIGQLSQSDCSIEEFFDGFLPRVTSALASIGGAVWRLNDKGRLELQYQINLAKTGIGPEMENREAHDLLLTRLIDSPDSVLVQPDSGAIEKGEAGNPTDCLLVIEPLIVDRKVVGLVEVFQRAGGGPATQRGYLRFLNQMTAVASDYLRNHRLRLFQNEQKLWDKLEGFIRGVHHDLDPRKTAYTIANEGRRLINCDRVSVARKHGSKCKIQVVSGLDSIDRRAADIKLLNNLINAVVKSDKPLWYSGDTTDLSPQIEKRLQKYVDVSHAKIITIIPLRENSKEELQEDPTKRSASDSISQRKLGALVVEQLADESVDPSFKKRVQVVASHSTDALTNATRYGNIFLRSVLEPIGRAKSFSLATIPAWLLGVAVLGVVAFLMCVTPYDFELGSEGKLIPTEREPIFVPANAVVTQLFVPNDPTQYVEQNQLLAVLTNEELNVEIENLQGEYAEITERIKAINRTLSQQSDEVSFIEQHRLRGEESQLEVSQLGIRRQLAIKAKQKQELNIYSPARGQVVTWQLKEKLLRRPVKYGDNIMTIVNPDAPWELELQFPEKKMGHLLEAAEKTKSPLKVTFVAASDPQKKYTALIRQIDRIAETHDESGNSILVRASFDKEQFPKDLLREGTRVTARVHCGERPLGYVLFRDVIETVQQKVLFWL